VTYSLKHCLLGWNWHDLPVQGIGPALPTQHHCSRFKSSFIPKNQHTWDFHLLIPHKQNPHTDMNQVAVTKTLLQPDIQLCVASVAVHHGKLTFMGCMKDFPGLFNIHVSSERTSYLWFARDEKNGSKFTHREWKYYFWLLHYILW
jgi:hypothetical protein